jgi:exonuclease SbcD
MRFIHTADWHLGRLFYGVHLTDDQSCVLDQFVELVKESKPDIVIVAGDIYDRAVPPVEAVELLDDVLTRITLDLRVPVLLIAGNHDNPARLNFGGKLFARQGLHVYGMLNGLPPVNIEDRWGKVAICSIPYADLRVVRDYLQDETIDCEDRAMRTLLALARQKYCANRRSVAVVHAFISNAETCESERPLSVGGADQVNSDCFAGFNYTAVGHLHRPQQFEQGRVRYSGSLLKYSFDEIDHRKGVNIVDMDGDGIVSVETIQLTPRHDVRKVRGFLSDLLAAPHTSGQNDYLIAELLDEGAVHDPIGRLRDAYPNVLHIDRPALARSTHSRWLGGDPTKRSDLDLFSDFFVEMTGDPLSDPQSSVFSAAVDAVLAQQRRTTD